MKAAFLDPNPVVMLEHKGFVLEQGSRNGGGEIELNLQAIILYRLEKRILF